MSLLPPNFWEQEQGYPSNTYAPPPLRFATAPFLVFADKVGFKAPSCKHSSRYSAEAEAQRLAKLNPGVNYYVLGSLSLTSATEPSATTRSLV